MERIEPISYVYDKENPDPRQVAILAQVKAYCKIPETQPDDETWAYIWQALRRLSLLTCWAEDANDTFLLQVRTQNYSVKQVNACCRKCCRCDEDVLRIPLAYEPVPEQGYVSGKMTLTIGGHLVTEILDTEYLAEHTDWETGILYINREDFPNLLLYKGSCICLCNRDVRVTLVYNAGYEVLPAGILPTLCALLEKVDTDTSDNCAAAMSEVSGLLKRKKVGNVEYEWDTSDDSAYTVDKLIAELNTLGVLSEVMVYSRCSIAEPEEVTGEVV